MVSTTHKHRYTIKDTQQKTHTQLNVISLLNLNVKLLGQTTFLILSVPLQHINLLTLQLDTGHTHTHSLTSRHKDSVWKYTNTSEGFFLSPCVCLRPSPAPSPFPHFYLSPSSAPLSPWQHWHHGEVDSPTVVVLIQRWVTDTHLRTSLWKRHARTCTAIGQNTKWLCVLAAQEQTQGFIYVHHVDLRREHGRTWFGAQVFSLTCGNMSFVSLSVSLQEPQSAKWAASCVNCVNLCVCQRPTNWPDFFF